MSYTSCVLPGLYALRWGAKPEVRDVARYADELAKVHQKEGAPVVALFIMPQDSAAPDDPFRKAQADRLSEIMSHVEYAVAVFEGGGFFASLKRSALVAILLLSPKKAPVHVRATVEEALITNPPAPIKFDAAKALAELGRHGILTPDKGRASLGG